MSWVVIEESGRVESDESSFVESFACMLRGYSARLVFSCLLNCCALSACTEAWMFPVPPEGLAKRITFCIFGEYFVAPQRCMTVEGRCC